MFFSESLRSWRFSFQVSKSHWLSISHTRALPNTTAQGIPYFPFLSTTPCEICSQEPRTHSFRGCLVYFISSFSFPFLSFPFSSRLLLSSLLTLSGSQTNFPMTISTVTEWLLAAFHCLHLQFSELGLLLCALVHGFVHNDTGPKTKAWSWLKIQESHSCIRMNVGFMGVWAKGLSFSIRGEQQRDILESCVLKQARTRTMIHLYVWVRGRIEGGSNSDFSVEESCSNHVHPSISGSGSLHGVPWFASLYATCRI